ncbi:MAG: pyridoxal phosphate-dependent aminotransferase [Candidatus Aenigmatarchaeota archaeon]
MDEHVKRMLDVSFSATMRISKLADDMEATGSDIISLAVGEPDFDTPDFIIEAAYEAMKQGFTHYTPPKGIRELRDAIAENMRTENDLDFASDNVLVTPTKHAIFMSVLAHLDDGAEAILPDPAWVSYGPIVKFADGILRRVPLQEDDFSIDEEAMKEAITSRTEMMILNSPCNPTGMSFSKEEAKIIRDLAVDNDIKVVTDEVYEKLIFEGEHISLASLDGMRERTITVNGFSKAFAMTGWRIGWLACTEDLLENIAKIQTHSITCATSFAQKAAYRAMVEKEKSKKALNEMMDKYRERREIIVKRLGEIEGFECKKPESTFYTFPRYEYDKEAMEMSMYLLREAKVATTPGTAFGDRGENHLRLSFANSKENIEEAMDRIEEAVGKL